MKAIDKDIVEVIESNDGEIDRTQLKEEIDRPDDAIIERLNYLLASQKITELL